MCRVRSLTAVSLAPRCIQMTRPSATSLKPDSNRWVLCLKVFHIKIVEFSGTVKCFAVQMIRVILIVVDAEIWNCYGTSTWPLNQERMLFCLCSMLAIEIVADLGYIPPAANYPQV
jgi:hypothetical protein